MATKSGNQVDSVWLVLGAISEIDMSQVCVMQLHKTDTREVGV